MKVLTVTAAAVVVLLAVGASFAGGGAPPRSDTANDIVDSWLAEMAVPSGDRGWSSLSPEAQSMIYSDKPEEYWSDLEQVDWTKVAWAPAVGFVDDGVFYSGNAWLRSHPSTLPRFLVERGLVTPSCVDDMPFGIHLQMRVGWFMPSRIAPLIGKAGDADPCAIAFAEQPGPAHAPYDLVGGAWASPGTIQRVGVHDATQLVAAIGAGRENPPLDRDVEVTVFAPRELAVTWRGSSCDANSTLVVDGTADALRITVQRGIVVSCLGDEVVYDSILGVRDGVQVEDIEITLVPGSASPPPGG